MKKLSFIFFIIFFCRTAFSQQWLNYPVNAYANWVNIHDLDITGNKLTIEALISMSDTVNCCGKNIVCKHTNQNDNNYLLRPFSFELTTANGFYFLANPVKFCPNKVYHVAGTYDGDSMKYYVNGNLTASHAQTGNLVQNNLNTAIGNRAAYLNEQFKGYIDEVRIWNVARTQSEIAGNMYDLSSPATQTGLLAYYKFDGSYLNLQGNSAYNGNAAGSLVSTINNPYYSGSVSTTFCSPVGNLPVELKYFSATPVDKKVEVEWATASEINNEYFTVERSADDIEWKDIINLEGAGNSSFDRYYSFTDQNPLPGISYYRLRQTDYDGQSTTYEKKAVNLSKDFIKISFAESSVFIELPAGARISGNLKYELFTLVGKITESGFVRKDDQEINLTTIHPGIYIIRFQHDGISTIKKIILN